MNGQISEEIWDGLRAACPNVLLVGEEISHEENLTALLDASRPPVWRCDGAQFVLPAEAVGTLVLHNPATLRADDQRALLEWANRNPTVQIITVTHDALYPLVQAGRFLDDLYYWLNVVVIPG